jgi:hypothetical protein
MTLLACIEALLYGPSFSGSHPIYLPPYISYTASFSISYIYSATHSVSALFKRSRYWMSNIPAINSFLPGSLLRCHYNMPPSLLSTLYSVSSSTSHGSIRKLHMYVMFRVSRNDTKCALVNKKSIVNCIQISTKEITPD